MNIYDLEPRIAAVRRQLDEVSRQAETIQAAMADTAARIQAAQAKLQLLRHGPASPDRPPGPSTPGAAVTLAPAPPPGRPADQLDDLSLQAHNVAQAITDHKTQNNG